MATDRENRVAGADQYERGSCASCSLTLLPPLSLSLSRPMSERKREIASPFSCHPCARFRGRTPPACTYAPFRVRKTGSRVYSSVMCYTYATYYVRTHINAHSATSFVARGKGEGRGGRAEEGRRGNGEGLRADRRKETPCVRAHTV